MKLQHGKLYETMGGRRFRVTQEASTVFECRSYSGAWDQNGRASRMMTTYHDGRVYHHYPHLVREVVEMRWVPMPKELPDDGTYKTRLVNIRHRQMLVTLEKAREIAEAGHKHGRIRRERAAATRDTFKAKGDSNTLKEGSIWALDTDGFRVGFEWSIDKDNRLTVQTYGLSVTINL